MDNNKNNDFNLNESNNSNTSESPSQLNLDKPNKSDLSDFNKNSTKDSSLDKKSNYESKNDSNKENNMDNHQENDDSISLNQSTSIVNEESSTCEELHKDKVNIGETNIQLPKKKHTLLKVLLIIFGLIALLTIICFTLIDNTKSLSNNYDDINSLRNTYCVSDSNACDDKTLQSKAISSLFDEMVVNGDGTATINVSKQMIYTYVTLDTLNNLDFIKDNDIVINQFGYDLDTNNEPNKYINIYGNITYKGIKAGLTGQLSFEFEDNNLIIKFVNARIGKLPTFIYKNSLPKKGEILYKKDISYSINLADNIDIKLFSPSEIKDITYDEKTGIISIVFNYSDALSNINDELFSTEEGSSKFSNILNYYLGIGTDKIDEYINSASDYLKDNLNIDIDDIGDFIKMFSDFTK